MTETKKKINLIRSELIVGKNKKNDFSKNHFDYRSADDIYKGLKPLLVKYDVLFTVDVEPQEVFGRPMMHATASYKDDEVELTSNGYAEVFSQKGMSPAQCIGTASSYAIKYAMQDLFLLDDSKDPDAMNPSESQPYSQSRPQPRRQPQPRQTAEQKARHDAATAIFEAQSRVKQEAANTVVDSEGTTLLQLYRDAQQQGKGSAPSQALSKWAKENGKDGLALINAIHNTQAWV